MEENALPVLLREGLAAADTPHQRDMLLLSLLTAAGYAMPRYFVRHGRPAKNYYPSLMTLVVAPPASGKGVMNLCRRLILPIHNERRALSGKADKELLSFIPANSSSNAFLQLLLDNDGRGMMIETEMDTLSATWRRDYGNYSAAFRQAFEHETISKARKLKGEAFLEVPCPQLSVLLSGTVNQLMPLLQSRENGLASRFVCYCTDEVIPFREDAILMPSEGVSDTASATYEHLGSEMLRMYHWLLRQEHEVEFRLTDEHAAMLRNWFHDGYLLTLGDMQMPLSFDATVKRLAVSVLRLGMIISMLRYYEEQAVPALERGEQPACPEQIVCSDTDFETMIHMAEVLLCHAIGLHELLPQEEQQKPLELVNETADNDLRPLLDALPKQFTAKEALEVGKKAGHSRRKMQQIMAEWLQQKLTTRIARGQYVKI